MGRRGSMLGLGPVKKPYRKRYQPKGLDIWDGRVTAGWEIPAGTVVTVTAHYGPFRVIEDGQGNEMSVGKGSLVPVKNVGRPGKAES